MSTQTSIGSGENRGGNEDHGNADGCGNKTLGDRSTQQPPTGAGVIDEASVDVPAGVPGARPKPGVKKGPESFPEGPNVESSPWEVDAAKGKLPGDR